MSLKKKLINFSTIFGHSDVENHYPLDCCLPVYHCVSDDHLPHLKHIIHYKKVKEFIKDLDFMWQHFQFLNWDEFKRFKAGELQIKKTPALLTFDDGLSCFYETVAPILEQKGLFAINFVNPAFAENNQLMFRCKASLIIEEITKNKESQNIIRQYFKNNDLKENLLIKKINLINYLEQEKLDELGQMLNLNFEGYAQKNKPYLSTSQMKNLCKRGFRISSHSWDHPLFYELDLEQQLASVKKNIEFNEQHGFCTESFAFPFTDFGVSKQFFQEIFDRHHLFCSFGSAGIKMDSFPQNFQRIPMETGETAEEILRHQIAYFNLKKLFYKNRIKRA